MLERTPGLDSIVRFEGEETLLELVEYVAKPEQWAAIRGLSFRGAIGITANPPRALIADLDTLPFPIRDATSRHLGDPHFFVVTTRGCPFTCTFCSIPAFYRAAPGLSWRARSIDNVISELKYLTTEWGAKTISFLDDEFLVGRNGKKRAIELATEMQRRGLDLTWAFECRADDVDAELFSRLKAGGLRHVFVGVESGVQRVLDTFDKRTTVEQNRAAIKTIRSLGLSLATGFIMFDPFSTTAELRENVRFLDEMGIGSYKAVANKVLVYAGTRLEQDLDRAGRLLRDGLALGYEFHAPGVALAYRLATRCLEPTHRVDIERRRMEFSLDNATVNRPAVEQLRSRLSAIERETNAALVGTMLDIIAFAEAHDGADESTLVAFEHELRDQVSAGSAIWLKMLTGVKNDLAPTR
jgi:anaerobic magnesium-protoporphyrin IX monomethyl ester cyclase